MPTTGKLFLGGTQISGGVGPAVFDEGASTGATFSTLTNPDGDGKNFRLASFTNNGTFTLALSEPGYAQVLVISGGTSGAKGQNGGSGAGTSGPSYAYEGYAFLSTSEQVIVGAGGAAHTDNGGRGKVGGLSSISTIVSGRGEGGGVQWSGHGGDNFVSRITGADVTYCLRNAGKPATVPGSSGSTVGGAPGEAAGAGAKGVVYVRVEI